MKDVGAPIREVTGKGGGVTTRLRSHFFEDFVCSRFYF